MPWSTDKPILVPFDFSEHSLAAVEQAIELAVNPLQIHVLHVIPYLVPTEPGVVWGTVDDEHRIEHAIKELAKILPDKKYGKLHLEVLIGDPGHVSVDRAEELEADIIVMGSHGRTGLSRIFLGSVAERITRLAHCAVLVVKLPLEKAEAADQTANKLATA